MPNKSQQQCRARARIKTVLADWKLAQKVNRGLPNDHILAADIRALKLVLEMSKGGRR